MKFVLRNIHYIVIILLQVISIILLLMVLSHQSPDRRIDVNDNLYGLKNMDYDRMQKAYKNGTSSEVIRQEIGHDNIKRELETPTVSVDLTDIITSDILSLAEEWHNLNKTEKEQILLEVEAKTRNSSEVKKLLQNISQSLERLNMYDPNGKQEN